MLRRILPYILILTLVVGILSPVHEANAQGTIASLVTSGFTTALVSKGCGITNVADCFFKIIDNVFVGILKALSFVLWLSGQLLDFVLDLTIVKMSGLIKDMVGINIAWKLIRDLMNIAFIFLLVYEGITLIIGLSSRENIRKFIGGIVLASLLINFSLFFTKVLIDASNIVTVGFYNQILGSNAGTRNGFGLPYGLSTPIVTSLGLTSFYDSEATPFDSSGAKFGGSIIKLFGSGAIIIIAAFVFFAVSILFVIRYLVLIFLLMLSPIAYMGMALPSMKKYSHEWWESLKGQLLFAPIYMILTLIILKLMESPGFIRGGSFAQLFDNTSITSFAGNMNLLVNFGLLIGLIIASLVIAKKTAATGSSLIKEATTKATTFAGGALAGGSAWVGRKSAGRLGGAFADNANLQRTADGKGVTAGLARGLLYGSRQARDATFDVRNASIPTGTIGDLIQGTAGRTGIGKSLGLNDVNIPSIPVGAPLSSLTGIGKGATKGYAEEKKDSDKRVRDRESANASELAIAEAKKDVLNGSKVGALPKQIEAMEKALAKLSDKQTEALVAGNRELLDKLNFANAISVKQLEALNKSEQFSEEEKDKLKGHRFEALSSINDAVGLTALENIKNGALGPGPNGGISLADYEASERVIAARKKAIGLSDSEMEMIDSGYLDPSTAKGQEFISRLRSAQVENITTNKSGKFTTTQKDNVKKGRRKPLLDVLNTGSTGYVVNPNRLNIIKNMINKDLGAKGVSGLMSQDVTVPNPLGGPPIEIKALVHPDVIDAYEVKTLQRLAEELDPGDIPTVRQAIEDRINVLTVGGTVALPAGTSLAKVEKWLTNPNTQSIFS